MSADDSTFLRLAGRRRVGGAVVGVVRAAMDERLGIPVAELHVARPGRSGERLVVRQGQNLMLGEAACRVERIRPYTGRGPAGIELTGATSGDRRSEALGGGGAD